MFIYDMGTVQTYLEKWEEMRISIMSLPKFWEKVRERRETWCDWEEKKQIMAIPLPKLEERNICNCGNLVKRGTWKFSKKRELGEGGEKIRLRLFLAYIEPLKLGELIELSIKHLATLSFVVCNES